MEDKALERGITPKFAEDVLVTAFEGGINYWYEDVEILGEVAEKDLGKLASDLMSLGYSLLLRDAESDDSWELDYAVMEKGVGDCKADLMAQYALFDEIVFG